MDNRFTPGLSDELVHAQGLPVGAGQGMFEAPTFTCSHCCVVVIINPKRNRPREHCRGCDRYICDGCAGIMAQTHECKTFDQIIDEVQELAEKDANHGKTIYIG